MIKVVQLQYSTSSGGSSALRLQKAFLKAGIESSIISLQADRVRDDKIRYLGFRSKLIGRIDAKLQSFLTLPKLKDSGSFSFPILGTNVAWMEQVKDADYIYLHWILNGFLSLKSIENLAKLNKPIIVFMHDMWPITGGCHYSLTCEKYTIGCDECPMFIKETKNDFSKKEFKNKLRFYSKYNNLFFVSPSTWLYDCARRALLTKDKPVFYIPNILDNTVFKALDKKSCKEILNIDAEETVIAFGAVSIDSSRKGWAYLQKALEILHAKKEFKKVLVLIFGSGNNSKMAAAIPFKVKFMGYLKDEYSKVLVYNAADVFIVPSLADNQPTTVQESLSCGTPVVGFKIGGIPDMIRHKENGYLAGYQDSEDIAEGIKFCCKENLKGYMLPSFQPAATIQKHLDLFEYTKTQKNKK